MAPLEHPCKYGHFDCSDRIGGPCDNEEASKMTQPQQVQGVKGITRDPWPVDANGSPKKFGQLDRTEQRAVIKFACDRLQKEFEHPDVQQAFAKLLSPQYGLTAGTDSDTIRSLLDIYPPTTNEYLPVFCKLHDNIIHLGQALTHSNAEQLGTAHGVACNKISRGHLVNKDGTKDARQFFILH